MPHRFHLHRLGDVPATPLDGVLPASDASIVALDVQSRGVIADTWRRRAASELGAARGFAQLSFVLLNETALPDLHWLVARAVSDEVRHAEVCRQVASKYAGADQPWPHPRPLVTRPFHDVPKALHTALEVFGTCCAQETLGAAYLESCLSEAQSDTARTALRLLLTDEVDHGRIGWGYLAALPSRTRHQLGDHLAPVMLECVALWQRRLAHLPPPPVPSHGCPDPALSEQVIWHAVRDLVLPGLEHVGVPVGALRAHLSEARRKVPYES